LLVVFAEPFASLLVPWTPMTSTTDSQLAFTTRNPQTVKVWVNGLRYLGFFCFAIGMLERVLHSMEAIKSKTNS